MAPGRGQVPPPAPDPRGTADRRAQAREALARAEDEIAGMVVGEPDPDLEEQLFGIPALVRRSAARHAQLGAATGERTRLALAGALLGTYEHLAERARRARRAGDGVLLWRNPTTGRDEPWTAGRPRGIDEVDPFTPANVAAWRACAAAPAASPGPDAPAGVSRAAGRRSTRPAAVPGRATDRAPVGPQRLTWGGRATGERYAVRVSILVTAEMVRSPGEDPGRARHRIAREVVAAVLAHLTTLGPAACDAAAQRLVATPDVALTIADWETFEALRPDEDWLAVDVFPGFLGQLSRYAHVPEEALRPPPPAPPYGLVPRLVAVLTGRAEPPAAWTPAWHERYADVRPDERLRYAVAQVARARQRTGNRYPPGSLYPGSGLMFVTHGATADTGLWLSSDLRLYEVSERELALDAFRAAVMSAAPTVAFGWCVIVLTLVLAGAPAVVARVAARLAPLLEMTPAELQYLLATRWEEFVTVALAGWDIARAVDEVGLAEFVRSLKDPSTAAEMLFLVLTTILACGGGPKRGGAGGAGARRRSTPRVPVRRPRTRPPGERAPAERVPAEPVPAGARADLGATEPRGVASRGTGSRGAGSRGGASVSGEPGGSEPASGRRATPAVPDEPDAQATGSRATGGVPGRAGAAPDRGTGGRLAQPRRPGPPRPPRPVRPRRPRGGAAPPPAPPEPYPLLERAGRTWRRADGRPMNANELYVSRVYRRGGVRFYVAARGADWAAVNEAPPGAVVYVVRDGRGDVVYVGMTERRELGRLGEHIQRQGGEWLGQANRFEVKAVGLTQREALALEEDMIQEILASGRRPLNKELHPLRATLGRELDPQQVPRANSNFGFRLEYL